MNVKRKFKKLIFQKSCSCFAAGKIIKGDWLRHITSAKVTKGTEMEGSDYLFTKVQKLFFFATKRFHCASNIKPIHICGVQIIIYFNFHGIQISMA